MREKQRFAYFESGCCSCMPEDLYKTRQGCVRVIFLSLETHCVLDCEATCSKRREE